MSEHPSYIQEIEKLLGRALSPESRGSIGSLNDVPASLVEEARRLPVPQAVDLLTYYVTPPSFTWVALFHEEVVEGGQDASRWLRGRVLVPAFDTRDLLLLDTASILAPLGPAPAVWTRLRPWPERRREDTGAPAVFRADVRYNDAPPDHVTPMLAEEETLSCLEPVADVAVATRRWVAWRVSEEPSCRDPLDLEQIAARLTPRGSSLSTDARISIRALLAERDLPSSGRGSPPGFRGPDAWYAGDLPGGA
jgi:hypothetical protein